MRALVPSPSHPSSPPFIPSALVSSFLSFPLSPFPPQTPTDQSCFSLVRTTGARRPLRNHLPNPPQRPRPRRPFRLGSRCSRHVRFPSPPSTSHPSVPFPLNPRLSLHFRLFASFERVADSSPYVFLFSPIAALKPKSPPGTSSRGWTRSSASSLSPAHD